MPSTGLRSLRLVAAGRAVEAPAGDTRGPLLDRSSIVRVEVGYTDSPTHWDEQLSCLHRGTRLSHSSTLRITMARAPVLWSRRGPGWQGSVAFRRLPVVNHTVRAAVRTSVTWLRQYLEPGAVCSFCEWWRAGNGLAAQGFDADLHAGRDRQGRCHPGTEPGLTMC